jgi:Cap4 SAVED domain
MTRFSSWCNKAQREVVNGHDLTVLVSSDHDAGVAALSVHLPTQYTAAKRLAQIARTQNKPESSEYLRRKFPANPNSRSGDMGEILGTAFIAEELGFEVGPSRLSCRDHKEWAMRGDDILGARLTGKGKVEIFKGEAKSRASARTRTITDARAGLDREGGLPTAHSLTQFADRLFDAGHEDLADTIEDAMKKPGVRPNQVTHMIFVFAGNSVGQLLKTDLNGYAGMFAQHSVAVQVKEHQRFIREAYEGAIANGA